MSILDAVESVFEPTPKAPDVAPDLFLAAIDATAPRLGVHAAEWASALEPWMTKEGIVSPRQKAAFLGQIDVESALFTSTVENLNYTAVRLCQVWPGLFPTLASAAPCVGNPQALADRVYAGRYGNGNAASGDGWLYRGGGLIQLTFESNYAAFGKTFGKTPEEAAEWVHTTKDGAAASACWFWSAHHLNDDADNWNIDGITHVVNGGYLGAAQRLNMSTIALRALGGS